MKPICQACAGKDASRRTWAPVLVICAFLVLATVAAFWPALDNDFVAWDDKEYVVANPVVLQGLTLRGAAWAATTFAAGNWHPLTWLSHMADVSISGKDPRGHHLTSVLIHALNGGLLLILLRVLTGALWRPALAAALFALHPLRVESVAWIAERKDVLAGCLFLGSLLAYHRYTARPGAKRYLTLACCFALGLTAKPMLVTLPFVLLLLDYWPLGRFLAPARESRRNTTSLVLEKAPLLALAFAAAAVTCAAQRGALQSLQTIAISSRFANAAVSTLLYCRDALWPTRLAFIYSYPVSGYTLTETAAAIAAVSVVAGAAVTLRKTHPAIAVGLLWYLGMLVPVLGIVQVGLQSRADRYTYLPMIGISLSLFWALPATGWRGRNIRLAAAPPALAIIIALAAATRAQVRTWHDNETLFQRAVEVIPDNWVAESKLGMLRWMQGRSVEALRHYRTATRIAPAYAEAHLNAGILLSEQGSTAEAEREYHLALNADPGNAQAHASLGILLLRLERFTEAAVHLREAARREPREARHRYNLGLALFGSGDYAGAEESYQESLRLNPDQVSAHNNLGIILMGRGNDAEALEHFQAAASLDPAEAFPRYNIGRVLEKSGKLAEAAGNYREVLRLNPGFDGARQGLERTLRATGR